MKALLNVALCLFAGAIAAEEVIDESLLANRINQPKNRTAEASASITVEYDVGDLPSIKKILLRYDLVLEDLEPAGVARRYAGLSSLTGGKQQLTSIAQSSRFFEVVQRPIPYPGVFYVTAVRNHGRRVQRYLEAIQARPEVSDRRSWTIFYHLSEPYLFQCMVPEGEELFWAGIVREHPGVAKVAYTGGIRHTGYINVSEPKSRRKIQSLVSLVKREGLFFERDTFMGNLTLYVRPGDENRTIRALKKHGVHASLGGMLDGESITDVSLSRRDPSSKANVPVKLTLKEVNARIRKGLSAEFPGGTISSYGKEWGFLVEDIHKGVRILKGVETARWEKIRVPVHVGGFNDEGELRLQVRVMSWTSSKLGDEPPTISDAWHRYSENARSIAEDAYAEQLTRKITAWLTE